MIFGGHFGDLIEGAGNEVGELHFDHGAQSHHGCADGGAYEAGLGEGCIQDSPFAIFLEKPFRDFECAAVRADVLTHEKHPFVAAHFFVQGL